MFARSRIQPRDNRRGRADKIRRGGGGSLNLSFDVRLRATGRAGLKLLARVECVALFAHRAQSAGKLAACAFRRDVKLPLNCTAKYRWLACIKDNRDRVNEPSNLLAPRTFPRPSTEGWPFNAFHY